MFQQLRVERIIGCAVEVQLRPLTFWAGHYHCRGTVPWLGSMTLCSSRAGAHSIACHTGLLGVTAEGLLRLCDCLRSISCPPRQNRLRQHT